ncbi:sensor histidine kinase [Siminovitchia sediminis]|uniref:histidine kinase n=1 Tax=Siminovitchia sediminis TaxID=1274353 RepID=A0ABW4KEE5_9BACI
MKLRTKINLYTAVMFIILLLMINVAIYFTFSRMMFDSDLSRVGNEASQTVKGITQADPSVPTDNLLRAYMPVNGMLQIVHSDGTASTAVTSSEQTYLRGNPVSFTNKEQKKIIEYEGVPYAFVSIPVIWMDGEVAEVQLTESLADTENQLNTLKFVLTAIMLMASIPVLLSSRLLSNFITSPISSLTATMQEIQASGHYKRIKLPKKTNDELYQMGETFNHMIGQLEKNFEKQEQFVSNASHELKTPLTVIDAYADMLKRRGHQSPEVFNESVEAIQSESHRMKSLIEQLLLLAKHEEQWNIKQTDFPLRPFVEETIKTFQAGFQRDIQCIAEEDVTVKTDKEKFKQLLYIFLDNARKYSNDSIIVRIGVNKNEAIVEIMDHGIGIPKDDLPKVFDRFYRVEQSRARKSGGFGLGLPLAKDLAEAIGADFAIDSEEGIGTTVKIRLMRDDSH